MSEDQIKDEMEVEYDDGEMKEVRETAECVCVCVCVYVCVYVCVCVCACICCG